MRIMEIRWELFYRFRVHLQLLFLIGIAACADTADLPPVLEMTYEMACEDARIARADEIYKDLTPIADWNEQLIWEAGPGSRVLVVSWVTAEVASHYLCPSEGCTPEEICKQGRECPNYRYDTWVTVVPEIRNFFGNQMPQPLRIAQLLGLPSEDANRKAYMLEMYVSPLDLLRPCPDPEVSDSQCELDFPADACRIFDPNERIYADQNAVNAFVDYMAWFSNRATYLYTSAAPYPWTRLGYTYDWGNPENPIGLSEYIVHGRREDNQGIAVKINLVCSTEAYFERH